MVEMNNRKPVFAASKNVLLPDLARPMTINSVSYRKRGFTHRRQYPHVPDGDTLTRCSVHCNDSPRGLPGHAPGSNISRCPSV
jgi:hypothetical protein